MKRYSEDDTLKLKVVDTIDSSKEYLKNCVKIGNNYYSKEDQAYFIENKWFPKTSSQILFDHYKKQLVVKRKDVFYIEGVVDCDSSGKLMYGFYSPNSFSNCQIWHIKNGIRVKENCIDYSLPKKLGWVEHINESIWASSEYFGVDVFDEETLKLFPEGVASRLKKNFNSSKSTFEQPKKYKFENNAYNAEDSRNFSTAVEVYSKFEIDLTKDVKRAAKLIGDVTFGCEIECKLGMLPNTLVNQLGVIICKDGSIGYTPEFVTVPLQGAKGLQTLQNLFVELNKRCTTDYSCSLHYHIGTIRKDREFLVAAYKLYADVQKELHAMLPYYKTNPAGVKKDDKNYCMFLEKGLVEQHIHTSLPYHEKINNAYRAMFTWLMDGRNPSRENNRKNMQHPNGGQKWGWNARYYSLNFINTFLSSRKTLEFRAHQAVLSEVKSINWLFICIAIIKYAEANSTKIVLSTKKFNLAEVIDYYKNTFKTTYASNVSNYLNAYVKERQDMFNKCRLAGDNICKDDYQETSYSFTDGVLERVF